MRSIMMRRYVAYVVVCVLSLAQSAGLAQEKSVNPGINKSFENPNVDEFVKKFETESREIYSLRNQIVEACRLKPGAVVADVGAGTGLFTRLFAKEVAPKGKVYAVDIADEFIKHIERTCQEQKISNVQGVVCTDRSAELPAESIDLAFICDTYHHFEFPQQTLASIHKALKAGGRLVLIDFHRIEGKSSQWVLGHVRAGQEVFTKEIEEAGFKQTREEKFLKENYFLCFERVSPAPDKAAPSRPARDR
jgi:ubiquinone/menaquinone biosynthesis C-methylase UbiE